MLEVRKSIYSKNYENIFFREFAKHLHKSFTDKGRSGLLIGSPFCDADERLQIDVLLITEKVVCIIDIKNFSGEIKLPTGKNFEMGIWTNAAGELIKGGSSINPFIQLKNQKNRFSKVYNKHIQKEIKSGDRFNPNHTIKIVCFQEKIELNGEIPPNEKLNFSILDKINFLEGIWDIIDVSDKDVNISPDSYDAFKKVFRADPFRFEDRPLEEKSKILADELTRLDSKKLYADQRSALDEIKAFLENPAQQIFVLKGTANSGKSYLIPFIQELAYRLGIQETEIFASSGRVANNLLTASGPERASSIYSRIYGGQKNSWQENEPEKENSEETEEEEDDDSEESQIEEIPLRSCDSPENALFIVDEAQLVSDSFNKSIDLIFGTGYLLKDFLSFSNLANTKRKIIFIGDPFQLQLGKTDKSPLNPSYLEEAYKLKINAYELSDKPDFSFINKEALSCVDNIRNKYFNSLRFAPNDSFCFLKKEDILKAISEIIHNKIECHILCFSNEEAQKVNYWIKESIIKNGRDIAINDLVLFNNNISIENTDPFAEPKKVYNGQFATVAEVNNIPIEKRIKIKKNQESIVLIFQEIPLTLNDTGQKATILSLENYRLNAKAELSQNEDRAFKKLLNSYIAERLKLHPFEETAEYSEFINSEQYVLLETEIKDFKQKLKDREKVKTKLDEKIREQKQLFKLAKKKHRFNIVSALRKDTSTEYYKFKNSALLRFGWATTVHKSMSYKWREVIFNIEKEGTANENHFRWLYTGISRAKKKVSLINYKPISPYDKTEFVDNNGDAKTKEFLLISDSADVEIAKDELIELIKQKLKNEFVIGQIEIHAWSVRINFSNSLKKAILDFGFNKKSQFKFPSYVKGDKDFASLIQEQLKKKVENYSFESITDPWRKKEYQELSKQTSKYDIKINQVIQTKFKDKIKFVGNNNNELDLEIDYTGDGAFSKITAKHYTNPSLWENFQEAILTIKEDNNGF